MALKEKEENKLNNTDQNQEKKETSQILAQVEESSMEKSIVKEEKTESQIITQEIGDSKEASLVKDEKKEAQISVVKEETQELKTIENTENSLVSKSPEPQEIVQNSDNTFIHTKPKVSLGHKAIKIFGNITFIIIALLLLAFTVFTIMHIDNSKISSGVSILGIDVSGLERESATEKISSYIQESLGNNDIILKHNEFETNIGPEQIETKVNVAAAIDAAFEAGSGSNIFSNSFKKLSLMITPIDIKPKMTINKEQLETALNDISTQLPDAVKESDNYIDDGTLIVTPGKTGVVINNSIMTNAITEKLNDLSYINNPIEIATIQQEPTPPNIENIYSEIHKDAVDARYDPATHIVYPEEKGVDFAISLEEAKAMLNEPKEEYTIPLKTLYPSVTTNMIGMEAFPNLLSTFSTRYPASNRDRTTNLRLAASKIDGTVVLPGETFSYNSVVGARTIAAGYKEAAVYQDGQVVQGLGGGICQISTTLYNAALYANLEIVERRNHQFVPSYIGAGRDATVVYGSQDFKFKNNRNYAIKITCSVEGGVATFSIYGLEEPNEYEVEISASITSRNAGSFTSATYKTLKQNGEVVSSETIARDTYKAH